MAGFRELRSKSVVLAQSNIDTDQIIPARFLSTTERAGLGKNAFNDWRWQADGSPNPAFPFNQPENSGRSILLAGRNFGCGSSREHAPWALTDLGLRAIVSSEIADIFRNNSLKNGLLPIVLPESTIAQLFDEVFAFPGYQLTVDLERQAIVKPDGAEIAFEVQPFRRYCLLNGLDDIGLTLRHKDKIKAFEAERLATKPWLAHQLAG